MARSWKPPPRRRAASHLAASASLVPKPTRAEMRAEPSSRQVFTLKDEARHTASHAGWNRDAKLRQNPVAFVSAGVVAPLDKPPRSAPQPKLHAPLVDPCEVVHGAPWEQRPSQEAILPLPRPATEREDTVGQHDKALLTQGDIIGPQTTGPPGGLENDSICTSSAGLGERSQTDACSGHISDTSEDIVVFKGRRWLAAQKTVKLPHSSPPAIASEHNDHVDHAPKSLNVAIEASESTEHGPLDDIIDRWDQDQDTPESSMEADCDDLTMARLFSLQAALSDDGDRTADKTATAPFRNTMLSSDDTEAAPSPDRTSSLISDSGPNAMVEPKATMSAADGLAMNLDTPFTGYPGGARRRKQPPTFGVADAELEAGLQAAWRNDRERKKSRKAAREDLRKQGLLGTSPGANDVRNKYQAGIRLEDVQEELLGFLLGTAESLPFPPMDKHARKLVHELAIKLSIKSQSTGRGNQRRPILYRTKATLRFSSSQRQEAMNRIAYASAPIRRKLFPRPDQKHSSRPHQPGSPHVQARQGQAGGKAATFRDGEVVGASVPQIGQGNKGREMLEKMGWTTGTALGSAGNQGILEPVAQVVKRSKAGLG